MAIQTLIVDDHDDIRLLRRHVLGAESDNAAAGEACNEWRRLTPTATCKPNVVVLDESMRG